MYWLLFPALNPIIFHPLADSSLLCMCYFSIYLHSGWVNKCLPHGIPWIQDPRNLCDPGFQQPSEKNILGMKDTSFIFVPLTHQHRIENYNLDAAYLLLSLITTLVASQIVAGWSSPAFYSIKFR